MVKFVRAFVFGFPLLVLGLAALCIKTVRLGERKPQNEVIIGSIGEPETLNPIISKTTAASEVADFIFEGLLRYDENLNITGDLAESWVLGQTTTIVFPSTEAAASAAAKVLASGDRWAA